MRKSIDRMQDKKVERDKIQYKVQDKVDKLR